MAIPNAEKLMERAAKGERLGVRDRRLCVAYLMCTRPEVTNQAMADLFKVSERMIRVDHEVLRRDKADSVKNEDIGLVIADIAICFDKQVRDMEASKAKCKLGTPSYLAHCKTIFQTQLHKVEALQTLGYYPKNLGNLSVSKYEYSSVLVQDGTKARDSNANVADIIDAEFTQGEAPLQLAPPNEVMLMEQATREAEIAALSSDETNP